MNKPSSKPQISRRDFIKRMGILSIAGGAFGADYLHTIRSNRDAIVRVWSCPKENFGLAAPLKIMLGADLHSVNPQNAQSIKNAAEVMKDRKPDAVAIVGDIATYATAGTKFDPDPLLHFRDIDAPVIFTAGNHDYDIHHDGADPKLQDCIAETINNLGGNIRLLRNELFSIFTKAGCVNFLGTGSSLVTNPKKQMQAKSDVVGVDNLVADNRDCLQRGGVNIFMSHEPDVLSAIQDKPFFDFAFCGHTHGASRWILQANNGLRGAKFGPFSVTYNTGLGTFNTSDGEKDKATQVLTTNGIGASQFFLNMFGGRVAQANIDEVNFV